MQTCSGEMEQSESTVNNSLVFAVNGKRFEDSTIHPSTTLLEFLRSHTPFKGAKLSCGEGLSLSFTSALLLVFASLYMHILLWSYASLFSQFGFFFFFDGYIGVFLCVEFPLSSSLYCLL